MTLCFSIKFNCTHPELNLILYIALLPDVYKFAVSIHRLQRLNRESFAEITRTTTVTIFYLVNIFVYRFFYVI